MFHPSQTALRTGDPTSAQDVSSDSLWAVADDFRAWVIADLQSLPQAERLGFRGDYLFVIDGSPLFLVMVTPESVSSARWSSSEGSLRSDMGHPVELDSNVVRTIADGQVRVSVQTDANTLRRLLQGNLRAKVAYLNGMVKISGDLPCFMRLVAVLKGRGVGPARSGRLSQRD
ncbi:MAG: hypothetical protein RL189_1348 [Pseudomonadota bacterium]|jgi:hypothetical protein